VPVEARIADCAALNDVDVSVIALVNAVAAVQPADVLDSIDTTTRLPGRHGGSISRFPSYRPLFTRGAQL
jgi:hypothetical protein